MTTLDRRTLNRTLLARQGLLERRAMPAAAMVEHLVGLQAQIPWTPFVGLWSRLEGFGTDELSRMVAGGQAVRIAAMRWTLHLVTLGDARRVRPVLEPVVRARFEGGWRKALGGADVDAIGAAALPLLRERPRTRKELSDLLCDRWPEATPEAVGLAAVIANPVMQVPPRGEWGRSRQPAWAPIPGPLDATATAGDLVRRYLTAFGPATVADVRTWSGLTSLREVVDRLDLRSSRDEAGRELLDVPGGAIVDADTPAPPRLLPEYDNVFLSHADRARIVDGLDPLKDLPRGRFRGSVLVDGFVRGHWSCDGSAVTLHGVTPDDALVAEADALAAFLSSPPAPRAP